MRYRHVRLTSGQETRIGYVPDLPEVEVGASLILRGEKGRWMVRYVGVTRSDVAGGKHTWEVEATDEAEESDPIGYDIGEAQDALSWERGGPTS